MYINVDIYFYRYVKQMNTYSQSWKKLKKSILQKSCKTKNLQIKRTLRKPVWDIFGNFLEFFVFCIFDFQDVFWFLNAFWFFVLFSPLTAISWMAPYLVFWRRSYLRHCKKQTLRLLFFLYHRVFTKVLIQKVTTLSNREE